MNIDPNNPLFQDDDPPEFHHEEGMSNFDVDVRARLIEATAPHFGSLPLEEWIGKLSVLESWAYGDLDDEITFAPE
jgi:hypothetical protein